MAMNMGATPPNPYAAILGAMASKPGATNTGPAAPVIPTGALGAPQPTGIGAMNTDSISSPEQKAKEAIMSLRDLKTKFPPMSNAIDGWIAQIQSVAKPDGVSPPAGAAPNPTMPPAAGGPTLPPLPV